MDLISGFVIYVLNTRRSDKQNLAIVLLYDTFQQVLIETTATISFRWCCISLLVSLIFCFVWILRPIHETCSYVDNKLTPTRKFRLDELMVVQIVMKGPDF
jgi:hypothetical protein